MSLAQVVTNRHVQAWPLSSGTESEIRDTKAENSFHWEFESESLLEKGNVYFLPIAGLSNNKDVGTDSRSHVISEIGNLSSLKECWDGPRSKKPSSDALRIAQTFVRSLPRSVSDPEICPAQDGEISISWRTANKFFEVSIYDRSRISFYARSNGQKFRSDKSISEFSELPLRAQLILRQI